MIVSYNLDIKTTDLNKLFIYNFDEHNNIYFNRELRHAKTLYFLDLSVRRCSYILHKSKNSSLSILLFFILSFLILGF